MRYEYSEDGLIEQATQDVLENWVGDLRGHQYSHYNVFLNECLKIKVNKCAFSHYNVFILVFLILHLLIYTKTTL